MGSEDAYFNACDIFQEVRKEVLGAENLPITGKEDYGFGRNELLERPATSEPNTSAERRAMKSRVLAGIDIVEIGEADCSVGIPFVHGIDSLRKLDTIRLVDAAGVDPDPLEALEVSVFAAFSDLRCMAEGG